jgi:hypothetical protein
MKYILAVVPVLGLIVLTTTMPSPAHAAEHPHGHHAHYKDAGDLNYMDAGEWPDCHIKTFRNGSDRLRCPTHDARRVELRRVAFKGQEARVRFNNGAIWQLVPCRSEDSPNCYWNAGTSGNGAGDSFVTIGRQRVFYLHDSQRQ